MQVCMVRIVWSSQVESTVICTSTMRYRYNGNLARSWITGTDSDNTPIIFVYKLLKCCKIAKGKKKMHKIHDISAKYNQNKKASPWQCKRWSAEFFCQGRIKVVQECSCYETGGGDLLYLLPSGSNEKWVLCRWQGSLMIDATYLTPNVDAFNSVKGCVHHGPGELIPLYSLVC